MNLIECREKRFPNLDIVFAYFAGGDGLGHGLKPVKSAQSAVKNEIFDPRMRAVLRVHGGEKSLRAGHRSRLRPVPGENGRGNCKMPKEGLYLAILVMPSK